MNIDQIYLNCFTIVRPYTASLNEGNTIPIVCLIMNAFISNVLFVASI